jgi:hypothetical protein
VKKGTAVGRNLHANPVSAWFQVDPVPKVAEMLWLWQPENFPSSLHFSFTGFEVK